MLKTNNIQENVLEKIHTGNVSMHSRTYFILRTSILILTSLAILSLAFLAFSFVFFNMQENGSQFLLDSNKQGLVALVSLFPWTILLFAIMLLIVLEAVLRTFSFGYRTPLLRAFLWILVIGITGSTLLSLTPLHPMLLTEADNDNLPVIGSLYTQIRNSRQENGIYRGEVTSVTDTAFVISYADTDRDSDEGSWIIEPPAGFDLSTITVGERIYVAGVLRDDVVYAYGIHHIVFPTHKMK